MNTISQYPSAADLSVVSGRVYRAELALHDAELTGDAGWIAVAVERLTQAVADYAEAHLGHSDPICAAARSAS